MRLVRLDRLKYIQLSHNYLNSFEFALLQTRRKYVIKTAQISVQRGKLKETRYNLRVLIYCVTTNDAKGEIASLLDTFQEVIPLRKF
jgi:hypothetical protein